MDAKNHSKWNSESREGTTTAEKTLEHRRQVIISENERRDGHGAGIARTAYAIIIAWL